MRNLKPMDTEGNHGKLTMWVDLIEKKDQARHPRYDIQPPPRFPFELRVVVFETEYVVFKDEISKCNDLFARGYPGSTEFA